jgi:predicted DNA-binding protein
MVATLVELPDELHQQIAALARQTGQAEADLLHEAIAIYVRANRAPAPKSDDTIEDLELAARDVDEWLARNWRPI